MLGYGTGDAGAINDHLFFKANETVFNDGSADRDFRVESDANTHMLFVDGGANCVGVGNAAASSYGTFLLKEQVTLLI